MAAGATYEPIATQTLASAAASITFSSIAASWTDLRLVLTVKGYSATDRPIIQFNGDTATNYSATRLNGDGTGVVSDRDSAQTRISFSYNNTSATLPTMLTVDIFSYAGSTNKTVLGMTYADANGSGNTTSAVGLWRSTAAITSIAIKTINGSTFSIDTTATLYGIKAA